ncbi:MAG: hypothetical protein HN729_10110 [Candidatus Marinimicrobia bacterium]|jgi:hypothetical protein|nr:hypothetical protein [Candidatus Neomarinimicrobiota bacterium]MBT3634841.1 hypothetical protein [Candidatus Neomarinimicrobiota bacterium]MBT3681819.1 hypothetical protein [Candidatus Neomarinimicrobiota bacterium]MBT3759546.1 hypothetical protein [Candidatus Neomarinimicrobiota bacterium]MBT3896915.1 hypothetical protein [Candidatus Neomarinimicrobiota bacterium]
MNSIIETLKSNTTLLAINLFASCLFAFILFRFDGVLGEDLFFHLKISELITNNGFTVISDMRWFQLTTWSQYPADLSLGFHLMLIPILKVFDPITAIKVLGIILNLILINTFFWILKSEKIKNIFIWEILLLFVSTMFFYRLCMIRPFLISISMSLIIFYSLTRGKPVLFSIASFLFIVFYTGWIQIYIILFFLLITEYIIDRKFSSLKYFGLATVAIALGLILRPDFPNILILNYQQVFKLLYLNFIGVDLAVGTGQRNADYYFFQDNIISILLMIVSFVLNYYNLFRIKNLIEKKLLISLMMISLFYFIWAVESVRFIEYFIPFSLLLFILSISYYLRYPINSFTHWTLNILFQIQNRLKNGWVLKFISTLIIILIIWHPPAYVLKNIEYSPSNEKFKNGAEWLLNNSPENSNVFITSWDSFSRLFFYNHHNNYTVGMDPGFFYMRDPELFRLWRNITEKLCVSSEVVKECNDGLSDPLLIAQTIRSKFDSSYIFTNNYLVYYSFVKLMGRNQHIYRLVSHSEDYYLFEINPEI